MRKTFLSLSPPLIGDDEISEVVETLRSGWITTGPKVTQFEEEFAYFVRAHKDGALAVSSGTAALHLALLALGIGPGDAVVTSTMTFCSAVHVIEHLGAHPILVDVEPGTLNMDVNRVVETLERPQRTGLNVKAIMLVHLYGHPCDLDALFAIAQKYGLAVIEDAAHALPAKYKGAIIGSHANTARVPVLTCFSFYATKNLTTAEGGMLVASPGFIQKARPWALHGMSADAWRRYSDDGSWFYDVVCAGYKYNMTDVQAAIGLAQLRKLPSFYARRRTIVEQYNSAFHAYDAVEIPNENRDVEHAWHLYVLRLNLERLTITRNEFISQLKLRNIGASVHFIPIHLHKYYLEEYGFKPADFAVADREYQRIVSLPLSPGMAQTDVDDVIDAVTEILERHTKSSELAQVEAASA